MSPSMYTVHWAYQYEKHRKYILKREFLWQTVWQILLNTISHRGGTILPQYSILITTLIFFRGGGQNLSAPVESNHPDTPWEKGWDMFVGCFIQRHSPCLHMGQQDIWGIFVFERPQNKIFGNGLVSVHPRLIR